MTKTDKIRKIYAIVIGVFVVAMGIALICLAADIYYSGRGTDVIFTRENVAERLRALAIPFVILIGAIAAGVIFPLSDVRTKIKSENAARLLSAKLPGGGSGEEYDASAKKYKSLCNLRIILWSVVGAVLLACSIATLVYMLNTANFASENITDEIFRMMQNVLPWIAVAFVTLIVAAILSGINAAKRVKEIKKLIKYGNGIIADKSEKEFLVKTKKVISSDITLWIVRGIVFAVAVTFIILGIFNGGANDVLIKAINICTECIGLG